MHVHFTQINAAPGYSLLAKAVSSAVSVVMATNSVRKEVSVSVGTRVATNGPFWVNRFVTSLFG